MGLFIAKNNLYIKYFNHTCSQIWIRKVGRKLIHPLIPHFKYITQLIMSYVEDADEEDKMLIARMTISPGHPGALNISVIGGIYIMPSDDSGIAPFTVYATSSYGSREGNIKRYDCFQIAYDIQKENHLNHIYDAADDYPFSQVLTLTLTKLYP